MPHRYVDRPLAGREDALLAEDHIFDRTVVGQHADDDLARRRVARTFREARAGCDQRLGLARRPVPDGDLMACLEEVEVNRGAHPAKADNSDVHGVTPV
jgi:hypothetical protein